MKRCWDCYEVKEYNFFGKHRGEHDGYRSQCKECRNKKLRTGRPNTGRFQKGHIPLRPFVKGHKPWIEGKSHSEETKKKISEKKKGIVLKPHKRRNLNAREWAKKIKDRDEWRCTLCGCENKKQLHAHHIVPWKESEFLRYDLDNGKTLCNSCHGKLEGYQKGHEVPEKTINKLKEWVKVNSSWCKGKKLSDEHRKKISESHKGQIPWNKGLKLWEK